MRVELNVEVGGWDHTVVLESRIRGEAVDVPFTPKALQGMTTLAAVAMQKLVVGDG